VNVVQYKTLCIVLHFGSEEDTNACLRSLASEEQLDCVVSDNDPKQSFKPPADLVPAVRVIKTGGVAGFSEGNNIAAKAFLSEIHDSLLILNNDTVVQPGSTKILRDSLFSGRFGAVGPCMPYADMRDCVWACGGYIDKLRVRIGGLQPASDDPYCVDYLPGAAILCRADLWKALGGLPEKYFFAYEEAEFALEIKKLGFYVLANPKAVILHKVGMSNQKKPMYVYNNVRNRIRFSKYLYGNLFGFIYGLVLTSITACKRPRRFFLWFVLWAEAIKDECLNNPLNKACLIKIESRYRMD